MTQAHSSGSNLPANHYAASSLISADPVQQRLMLLDGAIAAAISAADAIERNALDEAHDRAAICRGLLLELTTMLRTEAPSPVAGAMNGLTVYLHGLMVRCTTQREAAHARTVARLLESERNAWADRLRMLPRTGATPEPARGAASPTRRADAVA